jgi:bacillithiol system protein YtxJ
VAHAWVRVIEERPVSLRLAALTGVPHQSPQALLVRDGRALWHDSHRGITAEALAGAVRQARRGKAAQGPSRADGVDG